MADGAAVLVTGAAGFIGSHVCEALLGRGERVVGLDNFDNFYDASAKRANIAEVRRSAKDAAAFRFVEADIRDEGAMRALFAGERFGGVIHLAARAGVRPSIAQPALYARVNVEGTANLLEAARLAGPPPRFVCASSSSVYGNNAKTPFSETDAVDHPISPYAATKKACELIGHAHHHLYSAPVAMLRFFTVFGPRQRPDLAISQFIAKIAAGEPISIFGDGSMSRDFTFIDDIVSGVLAAYERIPAYGYRVWNLGGNRPVMLSDLVARIERVVGRGAVIERKPMQPGDVGRTWADLTRSSAELGFQPRTSFDDGLRRQYEWWLRRCAASASPPLTVG